MSKKYFAVVFLSMFFCCFQAKSQPKIDAMSGVERVFGTVITKSEEVMKKVNTAAKSFEENLLGDSLKTNYETFMALKQSIKEQYEAGKEAYENAKNAYNEGLQMYNEGKAYAEGAVGTITGLHEETVKKLQALNVSSPEVLESKMTALQDKMSECKEGMAEELEARLRIANENIDVLDKMYNETKDETMRQNINQLKADAEQEKARYQEEYDTLSTQGSDTYAAKNEEYQEMQEEYNEMASLMNDLKEAAKAKGESLATSFVQGMLKKTKEEKKKEYQELGDANFVKPDEPLNQAAVNRINNERSKNVVSDVASSYAFIIKKRADMTKTEEDIEQVSDNVAEADYAVTAQRLGNQQEVQKIKLLQRKIETLVAELRTKTSNNMLGQRLKLVNPNKNPAEINLDDYELTKEELQDAGLGE